MHGPSLIDDWKALDQHVALLSARGMRFHPGWDVWNWAQWHTPGAPASMLGPDLLDLGRLLLVIAGVAALAWTLLELRDERRVWLAVLPSLLILSTPGFAVDLARFGPQEPALIGGLALGAALLIHSGRLLLRGKKHAAISIFAVGYLIWVFGVYQKETSVCVLLLAPVALLRRRDLLERWRRVAPRTRWLLAGGVVAAIVPLLHMLVETIAIMRRRNLEYGVHPTLGHGVVLSLLSLPELVGATESPLWPVILVICVTAAVALRRRRVRISLEAGLLTVAAAMVAMSVQTGFFVSRYYLPSLALTGIVLVLFAARSARVARGAVWVAAVAVLMLPLSFAATSSWASGERQGVALVDDTARLASGCPVQVSGLDPERQQALPVLLAVRRPRVAVCSPARRYVVAGPRARPRVVAGCHLLGRWTLSSGEPVRLTVCRAEQ